MIVSFSSNSFMYISLTNFITIESYNIIVHLIMLHTLNYN